jgi:hypothetical protein
LRINFKKFSIIFKVDKCKCFFIFYFIFSGSIEKKGETKKKAIPFDIGAAFLRPGGRKAETTGFVPIAKDQEIAQAASSTILGEKFYQGFKDSDKEGERGVYYKLHSRSLADPASTQIENKIQSKVIEAVDESADIVSNMTGVKADDAQLGKILKKANIDQVSGNIFEAMLLNLNAPFDSADTSSVSFDFNLSNILSQTPLIHHLLNLFQTLYHLSHTLLVISSKRTTCFCYINNCFYKQSVIRQMIYLLIYLYITYVYLFLL